MTERVIRPAKGEASRFDWRKAVDGYFQEAGADIDPGTFLAEVRRLVFDGWTDLGKVQTYLTQCDYRLRLVAMPFNKQGEPNIDKRCVDIRHPHDPERDKDNVLNCIDIGGIEGLASDPDPLVPQLLAILFDDPDCNVDRLASNTGILVSHQDAVE